jgi:hypothetical protein
MATTGNRREERSVEDSDEVDLPEQREYSDEADAELDEALVEAIEAAEAAQNQTLAKRLRYELGSHYYETELDL